MTLILTDFLYSEIHCVTLKGQIAWGETASHRNLPGRSIFSFTDHHLTVFLQVAHNFFSFVSAVVFGKTVTIFCTETLNARGKEKMKAACKWRGLLPLQDYSEGYK